MQLERWLMRLCIRHFGIFKSRNHHRNHGPNAQDMAAQSDHLETKSKRRWFWHPSISVIRLLPACHLAQSDCRACKSKEETAITLGEMQQKAKNHQAPFMSALRWGKKRNGTASHIRKPQESDLNRFFLLLLLCSTMPHFEAFTGDLIRFFLATSACCVHRTSNIQRKEADSSAETVLVHPRAFICHVRPADVVCCSGFVFGVSASHNGPLSVCACLRFIYSKLSSLLCATTARCVQMLNHWCTSPLVCTLGIYFSCRTVRNARCYTFQPAIQQFFCLFVFLLKGDCMLEELIGDSFKSITQGRSHGDNSGGWTGANFL